MYIHTYIYMTPGLLHQDSRNPECVRWVQKKW